jgi:putative endonuclease
MTNKNNNVFYIGMCNNLVRRVIEHKKKKNDSFTKKYNINKLVYYEYYDQIEAAIGREKQLKKWNRYKKTALISSKNPNWEDLFDEIYNNR